MNKHNENNQIKAVTANPQKSWQSPVLKPLGTVSNLVLVGLGKLSPPAVDPGEPKKTKPDG